MQHRNPNGLLDNGQSLTRDELDLGIDKDVIWVTKITPWSKDVKVRVTLYLDGKVTEIYASAPPLVENSENKLLTVFTKSYQNWKVSGKNDTYRIGDFVTLSRTNIEPNEEGKRPLITLYAFRSGTLHADTDLLDFTLKTSSDGIAYDGNHGDIDVTRRKGGSARRSNRLDETDNSAIT